MLLKKVDPFWFPLNGMRNAVGHARCSCQCVVSSSEPRLVGLSTVRQALKHHRGQVGDEALESLKKQNGVQNRRKHPARFPVGSQVDHHWARKRSQIPSRSRCDLARPETRVTVFSLLAKRFYDQMQ